MPIHKHDYESHEKLYTSPFLMQRQLGLVPLGCMKRNKKAPIGEKRRNVATTGSAGTRKETITVVYTYTTGCRNSIPVIFVYKPFFLCLSFHLHVPSSLSYQLTRTKTKKKALGWNSPKRRLEKHVEGRDPRLVPLRTEGSRKEVEANKCEIMTK